MWIHDDEIDGTSSRGEFPPKVNDYAIYATILMDSKFRDSSEKPLLRQRTAVIDGLGFWTEKGRPEPARSLTGKVPGLREETVDDFVEKNREPVELKPIAMGFPYLILPESERQRLFFGGLRGIEAGYRKLKDDFPQSRGLITLSRVGFDRDRQQSIVAFGRQSGGRCGHGYYVLLESLDGRWLVSSSTRGWIS